MIKRFKDKSANKTYDLWINLSLDQVKVITSSNCKGNRDFAFKCGYQQLRNTMFPRNTLLYSIYVAGKEWEKVNKIEDSKSY